MDWVRKRTHRRARAKDARLRSEAIDEELKHDASVYRRQVRVLVIGSTADTNLLIQRFVTATANISQPNAQIDHAARFLNTAPDDFDQAGSDTNVWQRAVSETATEIGNQLAVGSITDVDLISTSYLLRASIDQAGLSKRSHAPTIHLLPASHSTDLYNRVAICYSFTTIGLLDPAQPKMVGLFDDQQPLFAVNLKKASTQGPSSGTKLIHTILDLYRSLYQSRIALRMPMAFLVFTHVDDVRQELETTTTASEMLSRIFDDFDPDLEPEFAGAPDTLPYLVVFKYIIRRFNEITPEFCQLMPIMMQSTPDRSKDRLGFQAIHDAILQNALRVCCCFGST